MNKKEIERLRRKFILIAMISVFLVMLFIGGIINTVSIVTSRSAIKSTLQNIIENDGDSQENMEPFSGEKPSAPSMSDAFFTNFKHNHFFLFNTEGKTLTLINDNTNNETETEAASEYAETINGWGKTFGRYGNYYYLKGENDNNESVLVLMDCSTELAASLRLLIATIATCVIALLITFFLVLILSGKMIRPEIENSERQKEFITNASHELKTPLAVIRANTELIEVSSGENEWTRSTLKQVDHMNGLIQNLVMIARAEEKANRGKAEKINATQIIKETIKPYEALASQEGKRLEEHIGDGVELSGEESKLRQLTTILVDNAIKYCDDKGTVEISLSSIKKGKTGLRLTVSNNFAEGKNADLERFFDRFYREDASHNIDKGGYGIGLSMAESVCKQASGSIKAQWKDGIISFIVQLP